MSVAQVEVPAHLVLAGVLVLCLIDVQPDILLLLVLQVLDGYFGFAYLVILIQCIIVVQDTP